MEPDTTACNRCLKIGVDCVPHNFAQKFMDEDAEYDLLNCAPYIYMRLTNRIDGKPRLPQQ